jgi:hypothetical protein
MSNKDDLERRALERIAKCNDPAELRRIAENAKTLGKDEVREAALRKLYAVSPDAQPGTLEHDVWQSIFALEGALTEERGKTTLLSRTRQKIARDGELNTVSDLVTKPPSEGFRMLLERGWPDLTFEAVALRHAERFEPAVLNAAKRRLGE